MRFVKGLVMGSIITAGAIMMYSDSMEDSRKKVVKTGRRLAKKVGII